MKIACTFAIAVLMCGSAFGQTIITTPDTIITTPDTIITTPDRVIPGRRIVIPGRTFRLIEVYPPTWQVGDLWRETFISRYARRARARRTIVVEVR